MEHRSIRRSESHVAGVHGHTLFRRAWLPEQPERALLVVHGYAEHSGRYEPFGAWFAARGSAVHAYDHQGHGRTSGTRCHVRRFSDLLDDLDLALEHVHSEHPDLPVFLVGHSMGGLTVAAYAASRRSNVAGMVTSGAALAISDAISGGRLFALRALRWIAPRIAMQSGIDANGLSRDPGVVRDYLEDPLVFRKITASLAAELMSAIRRTAGRGGDVRVPMLLLHGEADPICPIAASRAFYAQLDVPGSRLCTYPGLYHEIFNEPEREKVFEDLLDWVRERETALRSPHSGAGRIDPAVQPAAT